MSKDFKPFDIYVSKVIADTFLKSGYNKVFYRGDESNEVSFFLDPDFNDTSIPPIQEFTKILDKDMRLNIEQIINFDINKFENSEKVRKIIEDIKTDRYGAYEILKNRVNYMDSKGLIGNILFTDWWPDRGLLYSNYLLLACLKRNELRVLEGKRGSIVYKPEGKELINRTGELLSYYERKMRSE